MQELAWNYRVGKATVHVVIKETCEALWNCLAPLVLAPPTEQRWVEIEEGFYNRWNIPNCIGALDGKHVMIQAPKNSGSHFFNYKKSFSLVLMATCDAYYRFVMVDIGAAGGNHDSTVFKNSGFGHALLHGQLNLPCARPLRNTNIEIDCFLVADQAFPLHKHIMRPYPGVHLGNRKNIFNYRLSRARRTIENTFGILVQRWRIFRGTINASVEMCERMVKAAVVLHNFVQKSEQDLPVTERRYCPPEFTDSFNENGVCQPGSWNERATSLVSVRRLGSNNASRNVQAMRDILAEYFISDIGSVPWQWTHILRGTVPE